MKEKKLRKMNKLQLATIFISRKIIFNTEICFYIIFFYFLFCFLLQLETFKKKLINFILIKI